MPPAPPHKPVIDQRAAEQMNLNVLKRIDPEIEELLATAGHVALYDFDIPTKRWSRKDVEGSLFLVKRRGQPRFQFIILNKKSAVATDNFVEDVHGGFQCEIQKPYVLYRNRANEVVGIWFYDDADCDRISGLLQRIASTFAAPAEAPPGQPAAAQPAHVDSAATLACEAPEAAGGDDSFWDRSMAVPEELPSSLQQPQQSQLPQQEENGHHWQQPSSGLPPLLVPGQLQQQAAPSSDAVAALGSSNDLARLFAGIKVSAAVPTVQPTPVAAPAPAAATAPVMLLTPQLLQQEAAVPAPLPATGAASEPSADAAPGNMLLQSLLRGAKQQSQPAAATAQLPQPVDISEAADRALRSKVSSLLQSLAGNDAFCDILAAELRRVGLV